jgi:glycosyltransferase involved in cell wall biosynthesis
MVNPCGGKGISIFLRLADRFPETGFAAIPTWGTTDEDLAALRSRANISILPQVDDFDDFLRRIRVMLVPSLWAEARSRVILEAMSRGIPVIASDVGGLAEAKLGVDYLLPVTPVDRYLPTVNELMVPVAEIPEQNLKPWEDALGRLLTDRGHWEALSRESRRAALEYGGKLSARPLEAYLEAVVRTPIRRTPADTPRRRSLSTEKRRLLARRWSNRTSADVEPNA